MIVSDCFSCLLKTRPELALYLFSIGQLWDNPNAEAGAPGDGLLGRLRRNLVNPQDFADRNLRPKIRL